jgi:hypothetical protein
MMHPRHLKDVIIGVLVAYVVIDLLLSYATDHHRGMLSVLSRIGSDENCMVVVVLGVGAGILGYTLARRSRELFSIKEEPKEVEIE